MIETLWEDYRIALRRFIQRRVSDPDLAEDLVQEVFLKIHAKIGTLNDRRRIRGWLYQIARHAIIDAYRRHRPTEDLSETWPDVAPDDVPPLEILAACVRPMIERLPAAYRDAVFLSELEGLTQQQVGHRLGISLSAAKSRVQRGREQIKAMLLGCCRLEFDRRGGLLGFESTEKGCERC
ncbi:MAG: RNA polymerase sigma factor SigZ [Nitrospirae bacterium]|nr:RNA polymerase sigma factor SigZ [Nitrospirota bacterium]